MKKLPLRSIFSSILLGHLGAAAGMSGCLIVEADDPIDVPRSGDPAGSGGAGGTAGSAGQAGTAGIAGAAGTSGAGGSGGSAHVISNEGFDTFACLKPLEGAAVAFGLDSIEQWQYQGLSRKFDADGTECATATDQPACISALEATRAEPWNGVSLRPLPLFGPPGYIEERLITTQGDAIGLIDTDAELDALLGPIDTLAKLRLFIRYRTKGIDCEYVKPIAGGGYEIIGDVIIDECIITNQRQLVQITASGVTTVLDGEDPRLGSACAGRRPAGLGEQVVGSTGALARYLERQAYLEGASVEAFERFAAELASFGAPTELVALAHQARADEVRHHALLLALGRRFDPSFACAEPLATPAAPRSLYTFALENAVEGCVRETWGALLAQHQAARAADGAVRFVSELIADDETRHAELS
ncbi:MAG: ferritin-like domain-containing protein [Polyangiaceae bacterium]|nr:ferritin-like domain-containing protein [Polyangiaceae bacterium]